MKCPICEDLNTVSCGLTRRGRHYRHCLVCDLLFIEPRDFLSLEAESERYKHHQNESTNAGYMQFLRKLTDQLRGFLKPGTRALDYGCGPSPVLSEILRADYADFLLSAEFFDPLFFSKSPVGLFDLVTCSEVVEHFREPPAEFARVLDLVRPGGLLAIMTQFHQGPEHLRNWWYADDSTHVCFYSARTFEWFARRLGFGIVLCERSVVLLRR